MGTNRSYKNCIVSTKGKVNYYLNDHNIHNEVKDPETQVLLF